MDIISQIIHDINRNDVCNVAIVMHDNPDGDAIGSAVALEEILKIKNKNVTIVTQNKISKNYNNILGKNRTNRINIPRNMFDILFVLDCSEINRISVDCGELSKYCIVIDHHINFKKYGDIYWCEDVVATSMLIYRLITQIIKQDNKIQFTEKIATALYLGIRSDSFNFRNPGTDAKTHLVTADLLNHSANVDIVNDIERYQKSIFVLQQEIWNNILFDSYYKIMYVVITKKQIEDAGSNFSEAAYLVDIMKLVKEVDVAVLFLVNKNYVYVKARSNNVNISRVMEEFGGGGHKNAAGARIYSDSTFSTVNHIIEQIKQEIKQEKDAK